MENISEKEWMAKFKKTKAGKIMDLVYDVRIMKGNYQNYDKLSFLCYDAMISAKGTKHREDMENLIKEIYPEYINPEDFPLIDIHQKKH